MVSEDLEAVTPVAGAQAVVGDTTLQGSRKYATGRIRKILDSSVIR